MLLCAQKCVWVKACCLLTYNTTAIIIYCADFACELCNNAWRKRYKFLPLQTTCQQLMVKHDGCEEQNIGGTMILLELSESSFLWRSLSRQPFHSPYFGSLLLSAISSIAELQASCLYYILIKYTRFSTRGWLIAILMWTEHFVWPLFSSFLFFLSFFPPRSIRINWISSIGIHMYIHLESIHYRLCHLSSRTNCYCSGNCSQIRRMKKNFSKTNEKKAHITVLIKVISVWTRI